MSDHHNVNDEELTAYLDGEADSGLLMRIENALALEPAAEARLDALILDKTKLKSAFDAMLDSAPPAPVMIVAHQNWNFRQIAAAAVIALTVGLGAGTFIPEKKDTSWVGYVAAYQALYANSTLAHISQTDEAARIELARVSSAIGKTLDLATFKGDAELDYKRSQILSFRGRPLIQMAFLTPDGKPVALCIIHNGTIDAGEMQLEKIEGMEAAAWQNGGFSYVLIGTEDRSLIQRSAQYYSTHL